MAARGWMGDRPRNPTGVGSSQERTYSSAAEFIADPTLAARALFAEKVADASNLRTLIEPCLAMGDRECPQAQDLPPSKYGALTKPFPFAEALSQSQEESAMVYTFSDQAPPLLRGAKIMWTRRNTEGVWHCYSAAIDPKLSSPICAD